jgi:hypothetical protein
MLKRPLLFISSILALAVASWCEAATPVRATPVDQLMQMRSMVPAVARATSTPERLAAIGAVVGNVHVIERQWPSARRVLAVAYTEVADLLLSNRMASNALTYITRGEAVASGAQLTRLWARHAMAAATTGDTATATDLMNRVLSHNTFAELSDDEQRQTLSSAAEIAILGGDVKSAAKLYRRIEKASRDDHMRMFYALQSARQSAKLADKADAAADVNDLDQAIAAARRNGSSGVDPQMLESYSKQSAKLHKNIGH